MMTVSRVDTGCRGPQLAAHAAGGPPDKEAQLLESWKAYKTGFQQGIALFNKKPKKGIAFMQDEVRISAGDPEYSCQSRSEDRGHWRAHPLWSCGLRHSSSHDNDLATPFFSVTTLPA